MTDDEKDEQFYRDTEAIAFPKLDDRQLAMLEPLGHHRTLHRGGILFKAGQRDLGLTVVLSGEVEVFDAHDGTEQILATAGPRDFVGMWRCSTAHPPWQARGAKRRNPRLSKSPRRNCGGR